VANQLMRQTIPRHREPVDDERVLTVDPGDGDLVEHRLRNFGSVAVGDVSHVRAEAAAPGWLLLDLESWQALEDLSEALVHLAD